MKRPVKIFGQDATVQSILFKREEWRWLRREAKRKKLTVDELLNLMVVSYLGPGHEPLPRHYGMLEKFDDDVMSGLVNDVIRKARLAQ